VSAARALVFDLDGTLIDSRADLAAAINRTRAELGLAPLALDAVVGMVGEGARLLVSRALDGLEGAALDRALARFLDHYGPRCTVETRPYPGISGLLAAEAARRPLALLTNKPERTSRAILDAFGWNGHFAAVVGGDTLPVRKPDPGGLAWIAGHLGRPLTDLVLVGDTRIDADTALAAGCPFVWVEWGFARPDDRAELARHPRAANAAELAARLAGAG